MKKIIILISIISFLLIGTIIYVQYSDSRQEKKDYKAEGHKQTANNFTSIQKPPTSDKLQEDAPNEKDKERSITDERIADYTKMLAIVAFLQFIVLALQYFVMQRQGKVIPRIERAYLFMTAEMKSNEIYIRDIHEGVNQKLLIMVRIENHGKTPAILKTLCISINPRETIHPPKLTKFIEITKTNLPEGKVIGAGKVYKHYTYILITAQEWKSIENGYPWLTCSGFVRYKDTVSESLRETGFLWQYYPMEGYRRFEISNNTKLNYYT
jgi:hypothetical protein